MADTLKRIGREDQDGRETLLQSVVAQDTTTIIRVMRGDSVRSHWLRRVVRERGWPPRAVVGDSAAQAAWLVLQHSPFQDWQQEMLPVLHALSARGELPRSELALLTDRVLVHLGEPQRFGSQFSLVDGRLVPARVADLPQLDVRRAAMGLPPIAEYVRLLGEFYKLPVVWPPAP